MEVIVGFRDKKSSHRILIGVVCGKNLVLIVSGVVVRNKGSEVITIILPHFTLGCAYLFILKGKDIIVDDIEVVYMCTQLLVRRVLYLNLL